MSYQGSLYFLLDEKIVYNINCVSGYDFSKEKLPDVIKNALEELDIYNTIKKLPYPDMQFDGFLCFGHKINFCDFRAYGIGKITKSEFVSLIEELSNEELDKIVDKGIIKKKYSEPYTAAEIRKYEKLKDESL